MLVFFFVFLGSSPVPALNNDVLSSLNLPPLDISKLPPLDPNFLKSAPGKLTFNQLVPKKVSTSILIELNIQR